MPGEDKEAQKEAQREAQGNDGPKRAVLLWGSGLLFLAGAVGAMLWPRASTEPSWSPQGEATGLQERQERVAVGAPLGSRGETAGSAGALGATAPDPRAVLDAWYALHDEPPPPEACQERELARAAGLAQVVQHLREGMADEEKRAGEGARALELLRALEGKGPRSAEAAYVHARATLQQLRGSAEGAEQARAGAEEAAACSGFAAAQLFVADLAVKRNRMEEAWKGVQKVREGYPDFAKARFSEGIVQFQRLEIDAAAAALRSYVALRPKHAEGQYALGIALLGEAQATKEEGNAASAAQAERSSREAAAAFCRAGELGHAKGRERCEARKRP